MSLHSVIHDGLKAIITADTGDSGFTDAGVPS
jgi:hypothetical protein